MVATAVTVRGLLLTFAMAAFLSQYIQAQEVLNPAVGLVDPAADAQGLVLPETAAVGVPPGGAAAAHTAAIRPEHAATTVRLRRTSRLQAAAALRRAQPWRPLLQSAPTDGDSPTPQAICGSNSLVADNSNTNCRIVTTYGNGVATSCSATKIGNNYLATAGHCLYSKPNGGWASSIDVYCTGSVTCNVQRTTYATKITTTPSWTASVTTIPTAWDGAVIQTAANLPGQTHTLGQYTALGNSYRVTLTGYPAQSGDPGCTTSAYAGACYQYSSTDTMQTSTSGMYSSSNLDLCSGHSGSGVMTPDGNKYVTAIVTGASFSPCNNYFVPQINNGNGVNKDCERPEGGVSFACLAAKLA